MGCHGGRIGSVPHFGNGSSHEDPQPLNYLFDDDDDQKNGGLNIYLKLLLATERCGLRRTLERKSSIPTPAIYIGLRRRWLPTTRSMDATFCREARVARICPA
jgi:hypothetical protein